MATTKKLQQSDWMATFDRFTKDFVHGASDVSIELLSSELGDQFEVRDAPLQGISSDGQVLEVLLEGLDHLVFKPREVFLVQDEDGFIDALELLRSDGVVEIIHIKRAPRPAAPAPA